MNHLLRGLLAWVLLVSLASGAVAQVPSVPPVGVTGKAAPGTVPPPPAPLPPVRPRAPALDLGTNELRGQAALDALGARLPEVAAAYRMTPERLQAKLRADPQLRLSREGRLYVVEPLPLTPVPTAAPRAVEEGSLDGVLAPLGETFTLHSRPGASRTIYLNFKGGTYVGTYWSQISGVASIVAEPYDSDGQLNTFSDAELTTIQQVWQRVAEDYAPFDVDVTTELPAPAQLNRSSIADTVFGMTVTVTRWSSSIYPNVAGGVAFIGAFDDDDALKPAWVFYNYTGSDKAIAEAVSHEVGHTLGLHHDGTPTLGYYDGHGSGETGWAPIMGVGYSKNLVQWSRGEYNLANNTENDFPIMQSFGAPLRADDHGNTAVAASLLAPSTVGGQSSFRTTGVIEQASDIDFFAFDAGTGLAQVNLAVAALAPNLDALVEVRNAAGTVLASANPAEALAASLSVNLPAAGRYYVTVQGVGKGDPLQTGYTDYGSVGQYGLVIQAPVAVSSTVRIGAAAYTVSEGTASLTIPVIRSSTTGTASVAYATTNGTATAGSDYTATTGTLNFAAGVGTLNIVVPILNDTTVEPSETFTVRLSSPVNAGLGTPVTATVTIADNDGPTVKLSAATYSVAETGPSITIPVTRSVTTGTASVSYATANGTATAGSDYTSTSGILTFAAGVGTLNIVVPITNDTLQEANETFTVTLSAPVGVALTAPSAATVTILANDGPTVKLSAATYTVAETTASLTIPVTRSVTTGTASVNYATANVTTTAGSDYTATSGTLNFAAGVGTLNIVVPIINDAAQEPDETFRVTLSAPVGVSLTTPSSATVTIPANDGPTVKLGAAAYSVAEGTPSLSIPVTRSATTGTASVNYATANGTATAGSDYTAAAGTLNFAAGVATLNIVIPITNDALQEPAETFTVSLGAPVGVTLTAPTVATVTIPANDVPTVRLGAATYSVAESTASLTIPVTRSSSLGAGSVSYATANGTATAGADYTATSGTLNFAAGVATLNIVVPIINDAIQEPAETFSVTLSAPANLVLTAPSAATVTIPANDVPTIKLGAATYSVGEATASLSIPVTRSSTTGTASVNYATANGTATAGVDYTARSGTLSFAAGVATVNIVVPIINDTLQEPSETFTVTLSAPVGVTLATPSAATVTIVDNDVPQTLTVGLAGTGFGVVTSSPAGINCGTSCSAVFDSGTVVTLSTTVPFGSTFTGWSGACTGRGTCQVTMSAARSVTATFLPNTLTQALNLSFTGSGRVTSTPAAVDCTAFCITRFETGSTVSLTATPVAGQRFLGWAGACTGTGACALTMSEQRNVTAQFGP